MREPPIKKVLYWCDSCNVPLLGSTCARHSGGRAIPLVEPYDVRPALKRDLEILRRLMEARFGSAPLPEVVLLNKAGGVDRTDLVIAHGKRWGWLLFDPATRMSRLEIAPEALPFLGPVANRGIVSLEDAVLDPGLLRKGRIGGKRFRIRTEEPDGVVIVRYRNLWGTGVVKAGALRVKEIYPLSLLSRPDPTWEDVVDRNRFHLKNLERNAVRAIRQHMKDRPVVNVSFSGGKDSMAVLTLARKAGVRDAFFIDTGVELPETLEYVNAQGIPILPKGGDFWSAVEKAGPPGKDHRWCCKILKLNPLKRYLATTGPVVTIQGNRWYESWNRADLEIQSQNPANPLQLNISPIRNWRALEVYLYLRWQKIEYNPLYDRGMERIGCYVCPSMLESEYEELRRMHPELTNRWDSFLQRWGEEQGFPKEYARWGLWRWRELPPKMRELCALHRIPVPAESQWKKKQVIRVQEPDVQPMDKKKDFPILGDLIYLDSASTSLSPEPVLQAMMEYEHAYRANVGRGVHRLSQIASQRYWHAHQKVASFIGARGGEVVFTRNSTEAINMVAAGIRWQPGDRIITSILEHHSNLLPWMRLREQGVELEIIGINPDYSLDLHALEAAFTPTTKLVTLTHASNVLGVITPVEEVACICQDHGARFLLDGAQTVPHIPVDVSRIGCDYLCFSGHKMLGPSGTGVLWMREATLEPMLLGGGVIETVTRTGYTLVEGYQRYEAGTPNIAGGIGLSAAVDYLQGIGMDRIRREEEHLTDRLIRGLRAIGGVRVYAPGPGIPRIGVVSFTVEGYEPHEVANLLDEGSDIMVRSGHHCCMPLMEYLGLEKGTVRASLYLYNDEQDVDMLIAAVGEIARGG